MLEHLDDNPSLKDKLPETIASAFRNARRSAVDETGPDDGAFPVACPWAFEQTIDKVLAGLTRRMQPRSPSATVVERLAFRVSTTQNPRGRRRAPVEVLELTKIS